MSGKKGSKQGNSIEIVSELSPDEGGCLKRPLGCDKDGYGFYFNDINHTTFVNASHVNERYEPVNKPVRIIL